jgi:predicted thioesterase
MYRMKETLGLEAHAANMITAIVIGTSLRISALLENVVRKQVFLKLAKIVL